MSTETTERKPLTEQEYIANKNFEIQKMKFEMNMIAKGIVKGYQKVNSKFGTSFKVVMDHTTYYYNSQEKDADKAEELLRYMLPIGKAAAFTTKNKTSGGHTFKVIETIFYVH